LIAVFSPPLRCMERGPGDEAVLLATERGRAQSECQISASMKTFSNQWDITTGQIERIM
jgi:hypothetical protein